MGETSAKSINCWPKEILYALVKSWIDMPSEEQFIENGYEVTWMHMQRKIWYHIIMVSRIMITVEVTKDK